MESLLLGQDRKRLPKAAFYTSQGRLNERLKRAVEPGQSHPDWQEAP